VTNGLRVELRGYVAKSAGAVSAQRLPYLLVAPVVIFALVFLVARFAGNVFGAPSQDLNPFKDRAPHVPSSAKVFAAIDSAPESDRAVLQRMAQVPTAVWLTPEANPVEHVEHTVARMRQEARKAGRTAVFVVYGITDRDCSGVESSGGLPADQYVQWVSEIASGAGPESAAILEPDALATASECSDFDQRMSLLRQAVDVLTTGRGPTLYVDAGHANWLVPADMVALLKAVGVDKARGFSTNVSGYEASSDELAYAEELSRQLGGAHYVIDTSRNGAGSDGQWCNPSGRALGVEPQVGAEGHLDAYLWVKPPGESDGECAGGPPAGEFWVERAVELARNAGW
jgi:endoglucanase